MLTYFTDMLRDDDGQGLVEYAAIIALVSIVAVAALSLLGHRATNDVNSAGSTL